MAQIDSADLASAPQIARSSAQVEGYPSGGVRFDLVASLLGCWFLFGLFIDGWAHNHNQVDNTFFTPWHAILYTGVLANAVLFAIAQTRNMARGYSWRKSLPRGYLLSLIGVGIFLAGGGFDFVWHSLFGFEASIDALLSPAHLLLASGAFLFITGPLRAAWMRPRVEEKAGWVGLLPVVISLLVLFSLLTFFTQYVNPFVNARTMTIPRSRLPSDTDYLDVSAIASVIFQTGLMLGLIFFAIRRWKLPIGSLALILGANALLMYWMRYNSSQPHLLALLVAIGAGILAEVLLRTLRPSPDRPEMLRVFAFGLPFVTFVGLFGVLLASVGIWWSIHMWLGVSFIAGIVGVFMSYLVVPPRMPAE